MQKLEYKSLNGISEIFIGYEWTGVKDMIDPSKTVIITDQNINRIYGNKFPDCEVLVLEPGEKSKSLSTVEKLVESLLALELDRGCFLLGIGGGVVCDICGFVASVYMRGIRFGFVSTSLLSQLDASCGGKNGVNSKAYKNVIGCFNQPEFVICDTEQLKTLPSEEFVSGLGELVKHAIIKDKELFQLLEDNSDMIARGNSSLMEKLVARSLAIKISIVEKDERETSIRKLLNFGHTIGHAIETVDKKKHGVAIAEGICFASLFALEKSIIDNNSYQRIITLLKNLLIVKNTPIMSDKYIDPVLRDKKRESNIINFIVPVRVGEASILRLEIDELISWMQKHI